MEDLPSRDRFTFSAAFATITAIWSHALEPISRSRLLPEFVPGKCAVIAGIESLVLSFSISTLHSSRYAFDMVGANGISSNDMLKVLTELLERWIHLYLLSRRPPAGELLKGTTHILLGFLASSE
jgi:hypothetical protein